jgi:membrane dipeptidase
MLTLDAYVQTDAPSHKRAGERAFDTAAMEKGGLDAAVLVVSIPRVPPTAKGRETVKRAAFDSIASIKRSIEQSPDRIRLGLAPEDAYRFEKEDRHTAFIGLGSGDAIGTDMTLLVDFFEQGVRFLKLRGDLGNAICEDRGLSEFGVKVVDECNRLGLVIDVGGCSPRAIADVLASSRAPVVCSRGAALALCDAPGNLAEGTIAAIAAAGGVVLIPFNPDRLAPPGSSRRAGIADIAAHIGHVSKLAGPEAVGIGSDFGGGGGVRGCRDAAEIMGLSVELLRRGAGEHELEAIWGGNIMRVFKQAASLAAAR